jgi:hypothetical protein
VGEENEKRKKEKKERKKKRDERAFERTRHKPQMFEKRFLCLLER